MKSAKTIGRMFKGFYKRTETLYGDDGLVMAYRFWLYVNKYDQEPKIHLTIMNPSKCLLTHIGCEREARQMMELLKALNELKDM